MPVQAVELGEVEPGRGAADCVEIEPSDGLFGRDDLVVTVAPAEAHEIVAQRFGQVALVAIGIDAEGAMPLGELGSVGTMDQRQMGKFGDRPVEGTVDLGLAEGVVEVVVAADDVADLHIMVVDHHREIVGRAAVCAQNDQIVELGVGNRDLTLNAIVDRRRTLLRRLQPDDRRYTGRGLGWIAVAPGPVIADRALFGARPLAHRLEFGRRAIAVIGAGRGEQLTGDLGVSGGAG